MSCFDWKRWMEHEDDALLTRLHAIEEALKRALRGIAAFIVERIPELCRRLLGWLQEKFTYACRVAVRLARVAAFAVALLAIVFTPLVIYPGIVTGFWAAIAIAGSLYGAQRQIRKHQAVWTRKEQFHA
jgi:hypothetical protein